jgi:cell division septal protein FtsQ
MNSMFKLGFTIEAVVGVLVVAAVAALNFASLSALAQATMNSNQTTSGGKTMAANATRERTTSIFS